MRKQPSAVRKKPLRSIRTWEAFLMKKDGAGRRQAFQAGKLTVESAVCPRPEGIGD